MGSGVGAAGPATTSTMHSRLRDQGQSDGDQRAHDDRARRQSAGLGEGEPSVGGAEGYAADEDAFGEEQGRRRIRAFLG
ncbi:hypothetical protein D3C59_36340 [Streptomyces sp. SHP22-7]|nr:hypothetical protein D3C59_36340 [Streptomyces sp. SHP22-7]